MKDYSMYKFFKGEKENPFEGKDQNKSMFWFYERCWDIESNRDPHIFDEMMKEYKFAGLEHFNEADKTPITLKALLFNRYCRGSMASMEEESSHFKDFYLQYYN